MRLQAVFLVLAAVVVGCSSGKSASTKVATPVGNTGSAISKAVCPVHFEINGAKDPGSAALNEACAQLRDRQETFIVEKPVVDAQDQYSASVTVKAKLPSCKQACVSEIQKTFVAYVDTSKGWLVRTDRSNWTETDRSRAVRTAAEKEAYFKGISVEILAKAVAMADDSAITVPLTATSPFLTDPNSQVHLELQARLPNGEVRVFWVNRVISSGSADPVLRVIFYQKAAPGLRIYFPRDFPDSRTVTIECWYLLTQTLTEALTSDCTTVKAK